MTIPARHAEYRGNAPIMAFTDLPLDSVQGTDGFFNRVVAPHIFNPLLTILPQHVKTETNTQDQDIPSLVNPLKNPFYNSSQGVARVLNAPYSIETRIPLSQFISETISIANGDTAEISLNFSYQKFLPTPALASSVQGLLIAVPGTDYEIDDILQINIPGQAVATAYLALVRVDDIDAGGGITQLELIQPGYGYGISNGLDLDYPGEFSVPGAIEGTGAEVDITAVGAFSPMQYEWAVRIGQQIWPLVPEFDDSTQTTFKTKIMRLEKYESTLELELVFYIAADILAGHTGSLIFNDVYPPDIIEGAENTYTPQWYLTLTRMTLMTFQIAIDFRPREEEGGDITEAPLTLRGIDQILNRRDRRRDVKKGRPVTPPREHARRSIDLQRRRLLGKPMQNAF